MNKIFFWGVLISLFGLSASNSQALSVTDITGQEVEIAVVTTANGGRDFNAELWSANTAIVGAGVEFTLRLTSGDFGGGSNERFLALDFEGNGEVTAIPDQGFFFGGFYYNQIAAFDISINFTDPALKIKSATTSGDLAQGNTSASGLDPVIWSFITESDPFAGIQFGFNVVTPVPKLNLTAVPLPAALPLITVGLVVTGMLARCRGVGTLPS